LVGEDATIHAQNVVVEVDGASFPDEPAVIACKPVPNAMTGTVVGKHAVGGGHVIFCQYRLVERALARDGAARAFLADLLNWAAHPRSPLHRRDVVRDDGRTVRLFSWDSNE
jgi:hypothetical protein